MARHPSSLNEIQRNLFRADLSIKCGEFSLQDAAELLKVAQALADSLQEFYSDSNWGSRLHLCRNLRSLISEIEEFDPACDLRGSLGRSL